MTELRAGRFSMTHSPGFSQALDGQHDPEYCGGSEHGNFASPLLCGKTLAVWGSEMRGYDVESGKLLWQGPQAGSGTGLTSLPMTYEANGKQYILLYKDDTSDVYAYSL